MDDITREYLKKMARRRVELEMSIRTLSKLSGISESTLRRYEKGDVKEIRTDRLIYLMRSLGIPHMDYAYFVEEFKLNLDKESQLD